MKLAGVIFIILSAASMGIKIASSLKRRCRLIGQLLTALGVMINEIGCCGTPLPQVFALMAVSADGAVARLFSDVARTMDKQRWTPPLTAVTQALDAEPLLGNDRELSEILRQLSAELGKYDRPSQLKALEQAKGKLEILLQSAGQECKLKSKTYEVLGICAGISVAILLI